MSKGDLSKNGFTVFILLVTCFFIPVAQLLAQEKVASRLTIAEGLLNQQKYSDALVLYEEILSDKPAIIGGYRGLVKSYQALGDPQGAAAFIETLFLEYPENAGVHYGMGYVQFSLKNYQTAAGYFDRALQLNPGLAEAWNNRAAIYQFFERDYDKARTYYQKAITSSQRSGNQRVLSIARENIASLPAEAVLQPITEPLTLEAFLNRLVAAVEVSDKKTIRRLVAGQQHNCEQGMDWLLEQAIRASVGDHGNEENTPVLIARLLAKAYRESFGSDLLEKALEAYGRLSAEQKALFVNGEAKLQAGLQAEQQGANTVALGHYQAAVTSFKRSGHAGRAGSGYIYQGDVYLKLQQYALARDAFQKVLACCDRQIEPENRALVVTSLGQACFYIGDYEAALRYLKQAMVFYQKIEDAAAVKKVARNIAIVERKMKAAAD